MNKIVLFLVFILVFNCQSRKYKDNYKIIDFDSAITQVNNENLGYPHYKRNSRTSLNDTEISLFFSILEDSLKSYNDENGNHQIDINEYRFFIIPTLNDKKEEILLIYSYRCDPQNEWIDLSDWFMVFDGGNSYFRTKINLTKKTGGRIIPNGEA
ncbi:hypothetical protein [Winogradskyella forsetii]|uniref:hypothetical protein n=1 Tax=Winogradskyella forsetii TaxID=2686077 RepID=UPI0015BD941C|nr:hypothetical protein [Winogradskyella forsetii]